MSVITHTLITAEQAQSKTIQEDWVILDCRFYLSDHHKGQQEYDKGHIPNAIFVDVHHSLAGPETPLSGRHPLPSAEDFSRSLQAWGIASQSKVLVYDDMGGAVAARAWWMLAQQGIEVYVLNGGFPAWCQAGYAIAKTPTVATPSKEKVLVSFPWAVSEQSVIENIESDQFQLVDARSEDRFYGENETIDPVAGHIPGAINRPFMANLDPEGHFKPSEQLHVEWQDWLLNSEDYVYYCGSGITACHNVLALNYAGITAKRVYVGSWSQWAKRMLRMSQVSV